MPRPKIVIIVGLLTILALGIVYEKYILVNKSASGAISIPTMAGFSWKEVFSDEFTGTSLDSTKWSTCYDWYSTTYNGCSNTGNTELEWYMSNRVAVKNGIARLTAVPSPTIGWDANKVPITYPYQSGMISTGSGSLTQPPKWEGTYGYYEARMKIPEGAGIWPAFWLLPPNNHWPPEIDAMESLGNKPNQILMTYHWKDANGKPAKDYSIYKGSDFGSDWHTFGVNWEPGKIDWYIDGVRAKSVESVNVPSTPMEIILNLAVGGNLPGNPNQSTIFPSTVQIDYVHVFYQTKSS